MVVSRIQPNGPRGMAGHQPSTPPSGLTALGRRLGLVFGHTARTIGLYPIYTSTRNTHTIQTEGRGMIGHSRPVAYGPRAIRDWSGMADHAPPEVWIVVVVVVVFIYFE